ncbi:hypothetical protein KUF83_11675 [Streptomyces sp. BV286]|uniref:hypothetical protein n=1 Tax=Streptomyces sp. BV286 TaxID=2849672 RepID=UPI001C2EF565|nr:hypothetical protein [Streptomyces sp. BV286]MBV1937215.1 hypothetical protein [Streptomyces sp. BV286]
MSELMTVAGQLVPWLSAAAGSMGTAVLMTARDQVAQSVVQGGRTFLDAALGRRGEGDAAPDEANAALAGLSPEQRAALEAAIGHWLQGGDLSASALRERVAEAAAARPDGTFHTEAHGPHSVAVGQVRGDFNMTFGETSRAGG